MQAINTLVILGKPGAGKGTQTGILKERFRMTTVPYGEFFRKISHQDTFASEKIKSIIDSGNLLPYWLPSYVLIDYMVNHVQSGQGVILDGAARTKEEAYIVEKVLTWFDRPYKAIYIDIDDEIALSRLSERKELLHREDDEDDHVKTRLQVYHEMVSPAVEYFESIGKLVRINGDQHMEKVAKDIVDALTGK